MGDGGTLLEEAPGPHMGSAAGPEPVEQRGPLEISACEMHVRTELTIGDRHGRLGAEDASRADGQGCAAQTAPGMNEQVRRDAVRVHIRRDVTGRRREEPHAARLELADHPSPWRTASVRRVIHWSTTAAWSASTRSRIFGSVPE